MILNTQRAAVILAIFCFALTALISCSHELDAGDVQFRCDNDSDCATGYECHERPEGMSVCTQNGPWDAGNGDAENGDAENGDADACECDPRLNEEYSCGDDDACQYFCAEGFASCQGAVDGCETDITTIDNCGDCGVSCDFDVEFSQAAPSCEESGCVLTCDDGWEDQDGEYANGCECSVSDDPTQLPKCDAIYVSLDGSNGNQGETPQTAMRDLDAAIEAASARGFSYIHLPVTAAGESFESTAAITEPVTIIGGLDPENQWRHSDETAQTTIRHGGSVEGQMATTLVIDRRQEPAGDESSQDEPAGAVVLQNLRVEGPDVSDLPNTSVTTVRAVGVPPEGLQIHNSLLFGGQAADGAPGDDGQVGDDGDNGDPGEERGAGSNATGYSAAGGEGGAGGCAAAGQGGKGGDIETPIYAGEYAGSGSSGQAADGASGGAGGDGGEHQDYDFPDSQLHALQGESGDVGGNGGPGEAGQAAPTGDSDLAGTLAGDGLWQGPTAGDGLPGESGAGGGGGGAGGAELYPGEFTAGFAGNGGGGGGCGGDGGAAGSAGGASYVLVLIDSVVELGDDVTLAVGNGGQGGDGGAGACGGEGGAGAGTNPPYEPSIDSGDAGAGEDGGYGGAGGGGAAGVGGPAFGIAFVGSAEVADGDYTIDTDNSEPTIGGVGGAGGTDCLGPDGPSGPSVDESGVVAPTITYDIEG